MVLVLFFCNVVVAVALRLTFHWKNAIIFSGHFSCFNHLMPLQTCWANHYDCFNLMLFVVIDSSALLSML